MAEKHAESRIEKKASAVSSATVVKNRCWLLGAVKQAFSFEPIIQFALFSVLISRHRTKFRESIRRWEMVSHKG